ncbi:unnamed protein product [Effrenium voratum]|nr:unnamed protein product [Effrenium voratum]
MFFDKNSSNEATVFTNLEAVPGLAIVSMLCCCFLAETMARVWLFFLALLPVGLAMGLSTWGYLQQASLAICVMPETSRCLECNAGVPMREHSQATTFQLEMSDTFPDTAQYRVSCINVPDMEAETKKRLAAGDTIILHTERATGDGDVVPINDGLVASYQAMLTDSFQKTQQEAVVVLSFTQDQRSWYHLVSRNGSQMSYAKNHPVPLVETDILPGDRPPSVAEVSLGGLPLKVTGSICFDTDFPWLTRQLGSASLLLESSATWSNIGREHLHGHKYAALENGQTLIKCTEDGYTGAIDPFGSVIYEAPQSSGVVSFNVPRYPAQEAHPRVYLGFDAVIGVAACAWLLLAASPCLSSRWLGRF